MKRKLTNYRNLLIAFIFFTMIAGKAHSQVNDTTSNLYLKNVTYPDCKTMEFEIWLEYTGNVDQKFTYYQAGIDFNYAGMANGGTITGQFVSGSADATLPASQKAPNWNVNQSSKQIRMLAAIQTPESGATVIPGPPGIRIGKFRARNSVDFTNGSTPNFVFKYSVGTSTVTQTKIGFYFSGSTIATDATHASHQFVNENPAVNCGAACSLVATVNQDAQPSCVGANSGKAVVTLTGGGVSSTGTYVLDANPAVPYSTNPFTITGLSSGPHTVTVTSTQPCVSNAAQFTTAQAVTEDNNACTLDGCSTTDGVTHSPIPTDDQDACTIDGCNSITGVFHNPVTIDDGNACTADGCNSLTGVFHTPTATDDGDQCTVDACNSTNGNVTHTPVNFDDGNACTTDGCNSATGIFHSPILTSDDNQCTTDACNSLTGQVTHTAINVDDQNACTTDACNSVTGAVTHTAVNTDDGNPCTTDACNSVTGAITHNAINTDDQNACTADACNTTTGAITHTPVNTDDANSCTTDACNSTTGAITHTQINVDDQNACTVDACSSTTGISHTPISTDDGNACTTDACNSITGVSHTAVETTDNNACTTDACNSTTGAITHTAVNVDDGNSCTLDACNSTNGQITHTGQSADDGNACTIDACNSITGVTHTPVNTDDGNACTTDACNSITGVSHTAVVTTDNNVCTTDACNTSTGAITHTNINTDDGNACTTDACNSITGVSHTAVAITDGNACTTDACNSTTGAITHTAVNVEDNNVCTTDGCNTTSGAITHTPVNVDDGNACTTDGCNSITGPFHTPIAGCGCANIAITGGPYSSCGDVQLNGSLAGTATTGTWSSTTGGTFIPNATTLNAVYHPSATDIANGTVTLKLTASSQGCTAEFSTVVVTLTKTNDNNACTIDACNTTTGVPSHTPVVVDDGDPCTADACNTLTGVSHISKISIGIQTTPSGCTTSDGSATATPAGGSPSYTFLWTPGGQTTNPATGLAAGSYVVKVTDANGCTSTTTAVVGSVGSSSVPPGPISGPAGACRGQKGVVFCIDPVQGATSYIWTLPSGASGSSTGTCITLKFGSHFNGGFLCVKAVTPCGISPSVCLNIKRLTEEPRKPGPITGPISLCPNTDGTYSISPVAGATSYIWSTTGGLIILSGQGTTSIVVHAPAGFVKGTVRVKARNCQGTSNNRVLNVFGLPETPVFFKADSKDNPVKGVCAGTTEEYEIKFDPGATCHVWTAPAGSLIDDRHGNTGNPLTVIGNIKDVLVTFPPDFTSGYVTVSSCNDCGTSSAAQLFIQSVPSTPVWKKPPPISACPGSCYTFNIDNVQDAKSWTYTAPAGCTISSPGAQGSHNPLTTTVSIATICFPSGFVSGDVTVVANNKCGKSEPIVYTISSCRPGVVAGATVTNSKQSSNGLNSSANISETLSSLTAYPNPTHGSTMISFYSNQNANYSIKIVDIIGKSIISENVSGIEGYNEKEINLSNVSKGMYFITIQSEGKDSQTLRLIVE